MKQGTTILTLDNGYHLWTNTQGTGDIHLLCLHGGPGGNHEYWEDTAEQLKKQGLNVQVHMYDQLGSLYSDQPDYSDPKIADKYLTYEYFLDEVEEVRQKLGIDNFYLIGQSWGGLLVQEYTVKYGDHLKGAIISSMVDDIDEYVAAVNRRRQEVLPQTEIDFMHECEAKNDYANQRYQDDVQILNINFTAQEIAPLLDKYHVASAAKLPKEAAKALAKANFDASIHTAWIAFLGPLLGSISRPFGGKLADKGHGVEPLTHIRPIYCV